MKCKYKNPCSGSNEIEYEVVYTDEKESESSSWTGFVCAECLNTLKRRAWKNRGRVKYRKGDGEWKWYGIPAEMEVR